MRKGARCCTWRRGQGTPSWSRPCLIALPIRMWWITMGALRCMLLRKWRAFDPRGQQLAESNALHVNEHGGFKIEFALPDSANTGNARVEFKLSGEGWTASATHVFQVQEFRRPECKVSGA